MIEYKLDDIDRMILMESEDGMAYLLYHERFKHRPFALTIGCPDVEKMFGSLAGLYKECLIQNKTWEELLKYSGADIMQEEEER